MLHENVSEWFGVVVMIYRVLVGEAIIKVVAGLVVLVFLFLLMVSVVAGIHLSFVMFFLFIFYFMISVFRFYGFHVATTPPVSN